MTSAIGQNIPAASRNHPASSPLSEGAGDAGVFGQFLDKARKTPPSANGKDDQAPPPTTDALDEQAKPADTVVRNGKLHPWLLVHSVHAAGQEKPARPTPDSDDVAADDADRTPATGMQPEQMLSTIAAQAAMSQTPARQDPDSGTGAVGDTPLPAVHGRTTDAGHAIAGHGKAGPEFGKNPDQTTPEIGQPGPRMPVADTSAEPDDAMSPQTGDDGTAGPQSLRIDRAMRQSTPTTGERPTRLPTAGTAASAERLTVVAAQSIPAPAQPRINQTVLGLTGTIAGDRTWQNMLPASATNGNTAQPGLGPAHMLKIELHPAELGMVHVGLRLAGGQLSIEITPQTHEAYRHLASDTDAITRSMRDLGFDVGKVTLMQPALATPAASRLDGAGLPSPEREQSFHQQGHTGRGGAGEQQSGNSRRHEEGLARTPAGDPAGRGLVI